MLQRAQHDPLVSPKLKTGRPVAETGSPERTTGSSLEQPCCSWAEKHHKGFLPDLSAAPAALPAWNLPCSPCSLRTLLCPVRPQRKQEPTGPRTGCLSRFSKSCPNFPSFLPFLTSVSLSYGRLPFTTFGVHQWANQTRPRSSAHLNSGGLR